MEIAIISDIHNNLTNLKKVLDYCVSNNIAKIICCGDLASLETLDFLNDNFKGEIYFTFGNMDDDFLTKTFSPARGEMSRRDREVGDFQKYKNTKIYKDFGEIQFEVEPRTDRGSTSVNIAFVHYPDIAKELAETGKYNFVFYGHTHKPWMYKIANCIILNPGNVAGETYPATFAVWETEDNKFNLIRITELK